MPRERLHYLHESLEHVGFRRFVSFCQDCDCILDVSREFRPVADTIESLENRCPGCGNNNLESSIVCKYMPISEAWVQINHSDYSTRRTSQCRDRPLFKPASSLLLPSFSFDFRPLDKLVERLDPGWLAVITGRQCNVVAELLCFRAQLPTAAHGLDSTVTFIDGGNCSDPYLFSSYAGQYGTHPRKALRRVVTSRAFTMYQLANLVTRELEKVVDDYASKVVIISDILGTFNEPELDQKEARRLIEPVRDKLGEICKTKNVFMLATIATRTPFDSMVTSDADLLLNLEPTRSRIRASLLKHPFKPPASSTFRLQDLLRPSIVSQELKQDG